MKDIQPYSRFAYIYNDVMDHINYDKWASFILEASFPVRNPKSILDLGCGTGELLASFDDKILKKVGLDTSRSMLEIALDNYPDINWIRGKIQNFKINDKFELIICTHDTINYLMDAKELRSHFQCVESHLEPDGYYCFDISSEYNLLHNFHNKAFIKQMGDTRMTWENYYDKQNKVMTSILSFAISEDNKEKNLKEVHMQRYYSPEELELILFESGFIIKKKGSDYNQWKHNSHSCLINILVKKR